MTDYPEVSDLYLAADAAIVDYSSLRFDFGVTGKPMIFHVPDLQRYQDSPRLALRLRTDRSRSAGSTTTDEVVDRLAPPRRRPRREYAAAYRSGSTTSTSISTTGTAGERLVDAVFVPRGDA